MEELIDKSDLILPQYKQKLKECLRSFPEHFEKWFYSPSLPEDLYQGDIFLDVPVTLIDEDGGPIGGQAHVMLVSNSCDMQPSGSDCITVATIIDFQNFSREKPDSFSKDRWEDYLRSLTNNHITQYLYIPSGKTLRESIVRFDQLISINKEFILKKYNETRELRLLSLSQYGYYYFILKLTYHFSRREPGDVKREDD
ncbi:unnamed protein product [marine sediment metagenome]|uniref:Uncharacterized protein n=1 Tax=marine sediment metagenome TaxID=412755 RepID=X0UBT9_9ZZZZ